MTAPDPTCAVRGALGIDLHLRDEEEWVAEEDGVLWQLYPLGREGWLVTREEGTYGQALEAEASQVVDAMRAMDRAAAALNDVLREVSDG